MRIPNEPRPEWGRTKRLGLEVVDGEWFFGDWYDVVDIPESGLHHGSGGSIPADTVMLTLGDELIALGELIELQPDNVFCFDCEYYLTLRVRAVLEPDAWGALPFREFGPGNVIQVWDKFHGIAWLRGQLDPTRVMTYGGDFADLEEMVHRERPPAHPPARVERPSPAALLSAVRDDDLARVESLLGQGIDPRDLGPPDGVRALELGLSVARSSSPLFESIMSASAAITEALLRAGAHVDERSESGWTPLHAAVVNRRPEHVRILLRHGADTMLVCRGKNALELAEGIDPELAALVRGERPSRVAARPAP